MAGYSGTPLLKKLGVKEGQRVAFINEPGNYPATLGRLPANIVRADRLSGTLDFIQIFASSQAELKRDFARACKCLIPAGSIWISWPKKASGIKTDLNENAIRELGRSLGLVDVKVCAVDDVWSGLKFVYRLKDR